MLAPLAIVVALGKNRVIGRAGALPWHLPEDLRHFREVTLGHAVLMGRRTYESIGRPLPKRRNIVVSRSESFRADGCEVFATLDEALRSAHTSDEEPRVIGGEEIYRATLPFATRLLLTEVDVDVNGDAFFPAFDVSAWQERSRTPSGDARLVFVTLERREPGRSAPFVVSSPAR